MSAQNSSKQIVLAAMVGGFVGAAVRLWPITSDAVAAGVDDTQPTVAAKVADGDASAANVIAAPDGERGGRMMFSTRDDDGNVQERMRLTRDGQLLIGKRVGPWQMHGTPLARIPGSLEIMIEDPSRPGAIVMSNEHEAAQGVGSTLCWYASGHGQVFLTSSWLGEDVRRVKQTFNRPLPNAYPSTDEPEPTSASRMEIGVRVHDWVSLAAIFEPIADDGRAFVIADREHPYLGQVQYLPPGGEWTNNRRIGRHALLIGTTHTTGATAGGIVLAGDSYHEYQGKGPVIKSPNGTAFRIVVDDGGNLSTVKFD